MAVFRYDAGTLQSPRRDPRGFLRVDGWASRVGVQEYRRADGSVRRELRLPEDVFSSASLNEFAGAPITDDHPDTMVSPANVTGIAKGMILGPGRQDGKFVACSMVITDEALIRKMESGKRQLSVGYSVELDETPGEHPEFGRYDAIQRAIVPNHLAVVDVGRAGPSASVRMDSDSAIAVEVEAELRPELASNLHIAGSVPSLGGNDLASLQEPTVTLEQALAALAASQKETGAAEARAVAAEEARKDAETKVEEALKAKTEAEAAKASAEAEAANARKDADTAKAEAEAAKTEAKAAADKARADAADATNAQVKERVALLTKATAVLGADAKLKVTTKNDSGEDVESEVALIDCAPRAIKLAVIKHVDGDDLDGNRHDAYIDGVFDGACKRHSKGATALTAARATIEEGRKDTAEVINTNDPEAAANQALREKLSSAWMNSTTK